MSYVGKVKIGSSGTPVLVGSTLYGTCTSTAATAAKVATVSGLDTLFTGLTVAIKFSNSNTAANPTLNVSSTGVKSIRTNSSTAVGTTVNSSWSAGAVVLLTYDGTYWIMDGGCELSPTAYNTLNTAITNADTKAGKAVTNVAPAYSTSATYKVGQMVTYSNQVYVCTTAISTAEAWNSGHWASTASYYQDKPRKGSVYLAAASWSGSGPWTQTVTVSGMPSGGGVTARSIVSLQPDATALNHMATVGCAAIFVTNNNGTLTATAIQKKPTGNLTIQCIVEEVVG